MQGCYYCWIDVSFLSYWEHSTDVQVKPGRQGYSWMGDHLGQKTMKFVSELLYLISPVLQVFFSGFPPSIKSTPRPKL